MQTRTIRVYGKVQGVFYRKYTREKALTLGLTGEVKNLPDGTVYITATGTAEQLEALAEWCKAGPARAIVSTVYVLEAPLQTFVSFRISG
jgi:acylphosphatase